MVRALVVTLNKLRVIHTIFVFKRNELTDCANSIPYPNTHHSSLCALPKALTDCISENDFLCLCMDVFLCFFFRGRNTSPSRVVDSPNKVNIELTQRFSPTLVSAAARKKNFLHFYDSNISIKMGGSE